MMVVLPQALSARWKRNTWLCASTSTPTASPTDTPAGSTGQPGTPTNPGGAASGPRGTTFPAQSSAGAASGPGVPVELVEPAAPVLVAPVDDVAASPAGRREQAGTTRTDRRRRKEARH